MSSKYSLFRLPAFLYSLPTQLIGSRIYSFKEVDSTNQVAMTLAEEGAPEGTAVVADRQYSGRGQRGRAWYSPAGVGIYLSIILKPSHSLADIHQLSLMAAIATARCIESTTGLKAGVKWPNDVIINNHKVAGILVEAHWEAEIKHLILGIGLNVNHTRSMFLEQDVLVGTSLAIEAGREYVREEILRDLLLSLEKWHLIYRDQGFDPLWDCLQTMDCTPGGWVEVVSLGNCFEGEALGIDKDASLLVRTGEIVRRVTQGRIQLRYGQLQRANPTGYNITAPKQH
jgi:BirA family biotin operon repressor/biotin-[acetyl-CoA-carboxylase] ligase